ncbi:right-handed parallel beta-helix repeat-containing protein [Dokdonella sp.]|uniref:right-handed parallel beta-helix repeat-containing protein n=1 Tax=Dokdonella sp. TaxID=2291710 RepID=UPI003C42E9DE
MKPSSSGCALVLLLLLFGRMASAAIIEITPADNYRSAMQNLVAGDTLILHGGSYPLSSYFELTLNGTVQAPITIRAAVGENPVISYVNASQNIVNIRNSSHLVIDGIEFTGGSRGIRLTASSDITIQNCHVHHTAANAISANDVGSVYARLTFVHNEIDHAGGTAEGFYLGCNNDDCRIHDSLIANNYIHHLNGAGVTQGDGIEIKAGSYANIVRDNVIHDTRYPGITLYHTNGNGAPNLIERNVVWASGDNGIQVTADAIVRNNIVLSAVAHGIGIHGSQGGSVGNLSIINNTVLKASGDALHINDITGSVLIANNALYAQSGRAVYADGTTSLVTMSANVGTGSLDGVGSGFNASGNITTDFASANYTGAPPMDLVPTAGLLVATANAATLAQDDFNAVPRTPQFDVGAYRSAVAGNSGWPLQAGFKEQPILFADGFDGMR